MGSEWTCELMTQTGASADIMLALQLYIAVHTMLCRYTLYCCGTGVMLVKRVIYSSCFVAWTPIRLGDGKQRLISLRP